MSKRENYVHSLENYAFPPEIRFMVMIISGLTFSYVGYDIFAFLIILAGAGEASMQKKIFAIIAKIE